MKTKLFLLPALLLLLVMLSVTCKKKEYVPQLPPVTQTGENTFGCLVNGEVWLPEGMLINTPRFHVALKRWKELRIWDIIANRKVSSGFVFRIPKDSFKEGILNIPIDEDNDIGVFFHLREKYPHEYFSWNKSLQGELIISRLDTKNMIMSGTFWFNLVGDKGTRVEIRDGRFDLKIDKIQP